MRLIGLQYQPYDAGRADEDQVLVLARQVEVLSDNVNFGICTTAYYPEYTSGRVGTASPSE